ncbi:MAG: alpha/beta fold hydrolase [Actinobacteria bacterium]|nr:alpha/beta fold hydrolase [Actinomycetota bacterium]
MPKRLIIVSLLSILALATFISPAIAKDGNTKEITVQGGPISSTDKNPVGIDATIYLPDVTPAPAVILAHGFGGSKESVHSQAEMLQSNGYVVLTFSARGFGRTNAPISMNSPEFEIADGIALVNYLSERKEVVKDSSGDPLVGVAGGSYGGAFSLLLAGYDQRIDALASDITWNDLESSLFNQSADLEIPGVFKEMWTGYFFSVGMATPPKLVNECGRFSIAWCLAYQEATSGVELSVRSKLLMANSSPASVTSKIAIPTLLMTGQADSLFTFDQTLKIAKQIQRTNADTPIKLIWHAGGHDGGVSETDRLNAAILNWFNAFLMKSEKAETGFEVSRVQGAVVGNNTNATIELLRSPKIPNFDLFSKLTLGGKAQKVIAPSGGVPANITIVPGLGSAASLLGRILPNQGATFESKVVDSDLNLVGASKVLLRISSKRPAAEAVFFASLRIIRDGGRSVFPNGLVSAFRIENVGMTAQEVEVSLPAINLELNPGDKIQLVVTTTDSAYRLPNLSNTYTIDLVSNELLIPTVEMRLVNTQVSGIVWFLGSFLVVLLIAAIVFLKRPKKSADLFREELKDIPVRIEDLVKEFKGGFRAVDSVTWEVPVGKVVGLLGPNGAGKTTTMRMIMGLIKPTNGDVFVFGHRISSGSAALSNIGALVEGAGFLPHLSGRENLELFWRASGRTGEPKFEDVLEIADLGTAVERKVRTYSQGMRQRLGIAQAMLGMPKLLLLDEPTNGLDPPQIREMRDVLHKYAETGRTVVVSSHMLSEVEQTCSHVIVMHRGKLITMGEVKVLLSSKKNMRLEDFFLDAVGDDLTIGKKS